MAARHTVAAQPRRSTTAVTLASIADLPVMEMTQWESNQGITENNNNPEHLDEAQNIVPQQPQHLAPQGEVLVNIDEDEHNSWIVRGTRPGEETDRFAEFISTQEKELHSVYREFCRGGEGILRSAFAIFDITVSQGYSETIL